MFRMLFSGLMFFLVWGLCIFQVC